uniref:Uncharacterized protein LOC111138380 n=1 Tax=Crassostrea virginica TaxID=6565 RepID=A0A8B8F191_CRAVI|nr:uncharacterized protein LOC111138380 [Crassostrea virginica]
MRALLLAVLCCSILLLVSGQGNSQWNRMKNGPRFQSFRNRNTNNTDNVDSQTNNGRRPTFSQRGAGQGVRPANRGNGRLQRPPRNNPEGQNDWTDVVKASWNTSLSDQSEINERGFVSENSQIGFLMSTDPVLTDAGYNHSFAMIDFKSGKQAIRVEIQELKSNTSADRKSKEFWARKKHLCFIMDVPVTLQDFSQELQLRSSFSWAGPIPTGNLKTFVARQANKVTDLGSSGVIDRLCRKAASRGMAFSVVADSSVTEPMEKFLVTGQVDPLQPLTSVPYEIKFEPGIFGS